MMLIPAWQHFLEKYPENSSDFTGNYLTSLHQLGLIEIKGVDAKIFLQGQLTCHLDEISSSRIQLGAHCQPDGRIISLFRIFIWHNHYYLQMQKNLISIALRALKKYSIFFKVDINDVSDHWIQIGCQSNRFQEIMGDVSLENNEIKTMHNVLMIYLNNRLQILGELQPVMLLWEKLASNHAIAPYTLWQSAELKLNIPTIYPETSGKFLPHDIDLPKLNAISFNKGCFTGQEIIARIQYRGKLKKTLIRKILTIETLPLRGNELRLSKDKIAMIVDYVPVSHNQYEFLLIVR